jgi:hypothetical protein
VELVQVDAVAAEPPQRRLARPADVPGRDVGGGELAAVLVEDVAELGRHDHLVAAPATAAPSTRSLWPAP